MLRLHGLGWPFVAVLAAAILLAVPLWLVGAPGMPDYPAHLASFALIAGKTSPFYAVTWHALPNLASEAVVPFLSRFVPLEMAARLFLSVTVLLWVIGPALIQRALFGRVDAGAPLAAIFAYNANFMWGFFNYSFAIGLSFVVFAAWIASDGRRGPLRLLGFALAFLVIYFSHLFALATLLLAIGGFELSGLLAEPKLTPRAFTAHILLPALLLVPAAIAFLFRPTGTASGLIAFDFIDTAQDRIEAVIQLGFDNAALLLTGALLIVFLAGLATRRMAIHPRMRIVLALFVLGAVFAPEWALGGWGVHMRLPAVLGALAFSSVQWRMPRAAQFATTAAALILAGAGATVVARDWKSYDIQYAEFRAQDAVKHGETLLTVLDGDSFGMTSDQPYWHMAEFDVIDRGVFTPLMFTTPGQHIVDTRPPYGRIAANDAQGGSPPDIDELDTLASGDLDSDEEVRETIPYLAFFQCHYDQALVIHGPGPHARVPAMLRKRAEGSFYTLYDVVPDGNCTAK